jgi:hypothetical protein
VTAQDFRDIALSFPETTEQVHMDHPDFRVRGKIFATLGYPDATYGMVKLTPEQQHDFVKSNPAVFFPSKGAWGLRGSTIVKLKAAKKTVLHDALAAAWRNAAPKSVVAAQSPIK